MMKRILAVAIILLTLLPLSGIGDAAALHAQNFAYENGSYWIPDITVTGNDPSKVECGCCHETFDDEEAFARHIKHNAVCASYYYADNNGDDDNDKGDDPLDGYCCFCGLPINLCTCVGVDVPGYKKDNAATGGSGVVSGGTVSGGGGSGSKSPGADSNRNNATISVKELKLRKGVTLVSYLKLPDKLHAQTKRTECVVRAFSFMAELQGSDYATAYKRLTEIAIGKGFRLNNSISGGIYARDAITIFNSYCDVSYGNYDEDMIQSLIDNGKAVALTTLDTPPHMVTVIGYDSDFYYTAAGDTNGNVTIYPKNSLMGNGYIYISNINTPYK